MRKNGGLTSVPKEAAPVTFVPFFFNHLMVRMCHGNKKGQREGGRKLVL